MPSPIGHGLSGISVAWLTAPRAGRSLTVVCALLAASPDLDVLFGSHRGPTHSVSAALLVSAVAGLVAVARKLPVGRLMVVCGLAYASHLFLDWLGKDSAVPYGIMVFWPFSRQYYSSGADVFLEISRRYWRADEFVFGNLGSLIRELVILVPVVVLAWILKKKKTKYRRQNTEEMPDHTAKLHNDRR